MNKPCCQNCANMRVIDEWNKCCLNPPLPNPEGYGSFPLVKPEWWCRKYDDKAQFKQFK
jgi:hypothetical protein